MLAFDLDPGPPATIVECAEVAVALREAFDHFGLVAFPKTSGSKGMQVYVPLNTPGRPTSSRRRSRRAWRRCSSARMPALVVSEMRRDRRRARCSSTGARTTSTRRRSASTRCARASGRRSRRRSRGTRSRRCCAPATRTTSRSRPRGARARRGARRLLRGGARARAGAALLRRVGSAGGRVRRALRGPGSADPSVGHDLIPHSGTNSQPSDEFLSDSDANSTDASRAATPPPSMLQLTFAGVACRASP